MRYLTIYEFERFRSHVRNMKLPDHVLNGTKDHWNAYNMAIRDVIISIDKRINLIKKQKERK